jgi:hypothetical protein
MCMTLESLTLLNVISSKNNTTLIVRHRTLTVLNVIIETVTKSLLV